MKRITFGFLALALSLPALAAGCGRADGEAPGTGSVGFALQIAPGVSITSASYAIVGRNGFTSSGTVPVGKSSDVPVPVTGLPVATGYTITVVATAGITMCRGVAMFDVTASSSATVIVHLVCREPPRTGSIALTGTTNVCPQLDGLGASPDRVAVGGSLTLTALGHDADSGPGPLAFHWSSTSGTIAGEGQPSATFTCTALGPATITATLSDGDPNPTCADSLDVKVTCEVAP